MILVRPTIFEDVSALKALLHASWHETYRLLWGAERIDYLTQMWHRPETLRNEVEAVADASFVAVDGDQIVGHAMASDEGEGHVHLKRLYLLQAYHGQNIGDQLLAAALGAFPEGREASLEVLELNGRAVAFYRRHGFSVSERLRDDFAENELYEFRMVRPLSPADLTG